MNLHFKYSTESLPDLDSLDSLNSLEKINVLLYFSDFILKLENDSIKHFKPILGDFKPKLGEVKPESKKKDKEGLNDFKFKCDGSNIYNIQILKLLKLSLLGLDIIDLNSCIRNEDLKFINLKGFDISKIENSIISKPPLNIIVNGDLMKLEDFCDSLASKYNEYDLLQSQVNRVLNYDTPPRISPSNFIAWPLDLIPINKFGSCDTTYINGPYRNLIEFLQNERRKYPKKTIMNELYKEMANSVYGQTVRGIGIKNKLDVSTGEVKRMKAGELSNPIIGS